MHAEPAVDWRNLYRTGAVAAILMALLVPVQVAIYLLYPPPVAVADFFALFERNTLLGLLSLDLIYLIDNALMIPIYLAVYVALRRVAPSAMLLAMAIAFVGLAAYYASNTSFEMLTLSRQYASAGDEAQRTALLGAGEAALATYIGTAFNVYYVLNGMALLIIAYIMLRSEVFGRAAAWTALLAGMLMIIPSTAGALGLYFSLLSLAPWVVLLIFLARGFLQLAANAPHS